MADYERNPTITFELTDKFGNHYKATSSFEVFESLGEDELTEFSRKFVLFLQQAGYILGDEPYGALLMESLSDEERCYLMDCLDEYRSGSKK